MSLFAKVQKIPAKTAAAKKTKLEINIEGIQELAELQALIKNLSAVAGTLESSIKEAGFGKFLEMETKARPESFVGTDGQATCSVEMRKRGTNSALNADECEVLEGLGLKPFEQVITTQMYGINPAFAVDEKLMEKVSKALIKIVPENFFVLQEGASKMVVNDELLESAFALPHGSQERETALSLTTTMALKPRLSADYDINNLSKVAAKYLSDVTETTKA